MIALYILLAIVILLVMIVIHELGHYIAGKILKFKINEFSVGFGPKILSKTKKNGEVISLRAIPLGGFCAFAGETDTDDEKPAEPFPETAEAPAAAQPDAAPADAPERTFLEEKPWKRIIVLLSGGVANLLSAIVFAFIFIWAVGFTVPTVQQVYTAPDGSVYNPLQTGDVIRAVNGKEVGIMHSYEDLIGGLKENDSATLTVERNGERITVNVTKKHIQSEAVDPDTGKTETLDYVGLGFVSMSSFQKVGFGYALKYCVPYMFKLSWMILGSFGSMFTGKIPITDLSGPAGTVALMADLARANWRNIFILLPLIASNLGLFNLLPIPALDGSKVVFTAIEWIRGKPINRKVENMIHTVGILVLLGLVLILDLVRFIAPLF